MGTARIWWHTGVAMQAPGAQPTVVLAEPEISTETVTTGTGAAAASTAAPANARTAVVSLTDASYYRVAGTATNTCKALPATADHAYAVIDVHPGQAISFLQVP